MRLPRHATPFSLPVEHPREALARDEALLDEVPNHTAAAADGGISPLVRWWVPASGAVVVGLGLHHRLGSIVDLERCRASGLAVLERRAGGGAVLVDEHMICGALGVPRSEVSDDVTESYRRLGDRLAAWLAHAGVHGARRAEVEETRADVAALRARTDRVAPILLTTCYGALSPHEVVVGRAKLVGIAQVRRREAVLFQFGILLRDQSPLADYLVVASPWLREEVRAALAERTVGLRPTVSGALQADQFL